MVEVGRKLGSDRQGTEKGKPGFQGGEAKYARSCLHLILWLNVSNTGRGLLSTQCRVNRIEQLTEGSCSHRTQKYYPCIKIFVSSCSVDR